MQICCVKTEECYADTSMTFLQDSTDINFSYFYVPIFDRVIKSNRYIRFIFETFKRKKFELVMCSISRLRVGRMEE